MVPLSAVSVQQWTVASASRCSFWFFGLMCFWGTTTVQAQQAPNPALQLRNFEYPSMELSETFSSKPGTFRNNFCDAAHNVLFSNDTITLERALEGYDITTGLLVAGNLSFFDYDENGNPMRLNADYPGMLPRLLDELCERAGCRWRDSYAIIPDPAVNETFTNLLMWTTDVYDLSASYWARSIHRLARGATFTESWYDSSLIMIAPREEQSSDSFDPWAWLAPFDYGVWAMIVLTMVFSTLVYWLLEVVLSTTNDIPEWDDDKAEGLTLWDKLQPWETLWRFGTALSGHFEFEPTTGPGYLFSFSIGFWALLVAAAYTANLASFLVIRGSRKLPTETVEEAVRQGKRLCVWRSTQQEVAITARFPGYARSGDLVRLESLLEVFEGVRDGVCDIAIAGVTAWDILQRDKNFNGECRLERIGRVFETIPASFGVQSDAGTLCTSLLRDVLNVHLISMEVEGRIQHLWDEYVDRIATADCSLSGDLPTGDGPNQQARRRATARWHPSDKSASEILSVSPSDVDSLRQRRMNAIIGGDDLDDKNEENSELTLTHMGGVFLLHGLLSMFSIVFAIGMWLWKNDNFLKRVKNNEIDGEHEADVEEDEMMDEGSAQFPPPRKPSIAEQPSFRIRPSPTVAQQPSFRIRPQYRNKHDIRRQSHRIGNILAESVFKSGRTLGLGEDALEDFKYQMKLEMDNRQLEMDNRFSAVDDRLDKIVRMLMSNNIQKQPPEEQRHSVSEPDIVLSTGRSTLGEQRNGTDGSFNPMGSITEENGKYFQ